MKKLISLLLSIAFCISVFPTITLAETSDELELVHIQDFENISIGTGMSENNSIGEWKFSSYVDGIDAKVVSELDNNFLLLSAVDVSDECAIKSEILSESKELLLGGKYSVEFNYIVKNEFSDSYFSLQDESGKIISKLNFDNSGNINCFSESTSITLGQYVVNKWNKVKILVDSNGKTIDVTINDSLYQNSI